MAINDWMEGLAELKVYSPTPCVGWTPGGGNCDRVEGSFEIVLEGERGTLVGKWIIWLSKGSQSFMQLTDLMGPPHVSIEVILTNELKQEIRRRANKAAQMSFVANCLEIRARVELHPNELG